MTNNEDLVSAIKQIAPDAETDGLDGGQLEELLGALKANAEGENGGELQVPKKGKKGEKGKKGKPRKGAGILSSLKGGQKRLAPRKSVTTKRGIVAHPNGVSADDLRGGQGSLDSLIERGIVEK